jgi:phage tail sheath protein FI
LPVTVSYPGIYIEELPSSSHSVTAAPTSVTVFIGYTNPFWVRPGGTSPPWETATELHSFSDYVANFGGFFSNPWLPDLVGQAVFQFFENGGSDAYVVALPALDYLPAAKTPVMVAPAQLTLLNGGDGFTFTAVQPVGLPADPTTTPATPAAGLAMTLTASNIRSSSIPPKGPPPDDIADITIVYGTTVETYRGVAIGSLPSVIGARSQLVTVSVTGKGATTYDALASSTTDGHFVYATASLPSNPNTIPAPIVSTGVIDVTQFAPVFAEGSSLDKVPVFNLMVLPGITDNASLAEALSFCEAKRAFLIMDPPANSVTDSLVAVMAGAPAGAAPIADIWNGAVSTTPAPPVSQNGALYFPYLNTTDPITGASISVPPSGYVAGIFANEDNNRGVWKSPAGLETTILGTTGVVPWGAMSDPQQGDLNPLGINCIRTFPGIGSVVFGARTLVSENPAYEQWKYVAVRRMALFIEQSLYASLRWAIFEPNDTPLWNALAQEVSAFMLGLFRQGAFAGTTAAQAFQIQCDSTTTSPDDVDQGIANILVAFAPLKPAEFVVIQIAQLAGQSSS